MRILYLHQYFTTRDSAGGTRSYEMARRLVRAGHDVTVVTSSAFLGEDWAPTPGWHTREIDGIGVEVLRVPYSNKLSNIERIQAFLKFAVGASFRLKGHHPDVIFATSTPLTIAIPAILSSKLRRVPMVFEVRDLWPEIPIAIGALRGKASIFLARTLEKVAYRSAAHIVALSPGMKAGVVEKGIPAERVTIIPNSSDLDLFQVDKARGKAFRQQYEWLQDRPLVVYVGTLGTINSLSYFVDLAAEMLHVDPEIRFLVVGDGKEEPLIRSRAEAKQVLNRNFFMLPPMPKHQVPNVLSAATVATSLFMDLPAMWANSANKFFDALAASRPIAINHQGWQADLLRESGAGIVLSPNNLPEAATCLAQFIHDAPRLQKARKAAFDLATTRFNRDQLANQLEQVLQGVT